MIEPEDMNAFADGRRLVNVIDDIEYALKLQMKAIQNKAFGLIRKDRFPPDMAQQLWMEMYAAHKLANNFRSKVNQSISAAEKYSEVLTIGKQENADA